jgi:hypothetical protein
MTTLFLFIASALLGLLGFLFGAAWALEAAFGPSMGSVSKSGLFWAGLVILVILSGSVGCFLWGAYRILSNIHLTWG